MTIAPAAGTENPAAGITHRRENVTMKVRARWNVKDGNGWHNAGEVFEPTCDLGKAVEVLDAPKKPAKEPEKAPEPAAEKEPEKAPEAAEAPAKARSSTRRKVSK